MTDKFKEKIIFEFEKVSNLRYGENPHQDAVLYREKVDNNLPYIVNAVQLHGKELSFNNILDLDAALLIASEFENPTCVIIKHNNPCGVATDKSPKDACVYAWECDPISAFGGIVGINCEVDEETAKTISSFGFLEAIIAPSYTSSALSILKDKKNLRIMELKCDWKKLQEERYFDIKRISGGVLVQDRDIKKITSSNLKVMTKKQPSKEEIESLLFAFRVCKNVKSNAIVLAQDTRTIGIGAGQMSRVDSANIAIEKAKKVKNINSHKSIVMASDAFFPKQDAVEVAIKFGVSSIIQPGGSVEDENIIKLCNENNVSMVFTGIRHFKH